MEIVYFWLKQDLHPSQSLISSHRISFEPLNLPLHRTLHCVSRGTQQKFRKDFDLPNINLFTFKTVFQEMLIHRTKL